MRKAKDSRKNSVYQLLLDKSQTEKFCPKKKFDFVSNANPFTDQEKL
jgi:hypothetical protein